MQLEIIILEPHIITAAQLTVHIITNLFMKNNNLAQLEQLAARINTVTKSPKYAFSDGRWHVGSFFITIANGGFDLQRVSNPSGGASSSLNTGHIPASRLSMLMNAFLVGLTFKADEKRKREAMTPSDPTVER